jgi:hypothetical protein
MFVLTLICVSAKAALLQWQLTGVAFDDGATASGTFTLDTQLNVVVDFDITTSPGSLITSSFRYTLNSAHLSSQANDPDPGDHFFQLDSDDDAIPGATRELFFAFASPLVAGSAALILSQPGPGHTSYESLNIGQQGPGARVVFGSPLAQQIPVPEPASIVWLCLGLGILLRLRRARCE